MKLTHIAPEQAAVQLSLMVLDIITNGVTPEVLSRLKSPANWSPAASWSKILVVRN
jgi:hypothetical protein